MTTSLNHAIPRWIVTDGSTTGQISANSARAGRKNLVVGVLIRNELLRQGLDVILDRIHWIIIRATTAVDDDKTGPGAARKLVESGVDVIITTPAERLVLAPLLDPDRAHRPRILVLLRDDGFSSADLNTLSWSDGALLQEEISAEILDDALYRLAIGEMPLSRRLTHQLVDRAAGSAAQPVRSVALTSRESQALALLAKGMSNKEIARTLGVSLHGAKRLVGSILIKLGAQNRTAAVVNAIAAGIIDSP